MITERKSSWPLLYLALVGALVTSVGIALEPILIVLSSSFVGESQIGEWSAYLALALTILGLLLLFHSATAILRTLTMTMVKPSYGSMIARVFADHRYSRFLWVMALVYGGFYSFASGIIVVQRSTSFSVVYRVSIPSMSVASCCGSLGQTPVAVAYLTQHIGLVLVPGNLVLLFLISWLVGLNTSVSAFAWSYRSPSSGLKTGWLGGIGAFLGIFTACPTCASLAVLTILGGSSVSAAFFLGPFQLLLIVISIPLLIVVPVVSLRFLQSLEARSCAIPGFSSS